ncbi:hypothetical protein GGS24DRAFT_451696 [Hypoxylon argillaceum]|nr:hypothetical protein GGS24DRAFT_451696 [Hypoxylon argillaceum]
MDDNMSPKAPTGSLSQQQYDEDEDDISLNSTDVEDNDSEKEWEVEDILADRPDPNNPNALHYLIKWEGFKLEYCTWEPVENLGDGLLAKWDENKSEIEAGNREIFDLRTYEAACEERAKRQVRRNAKRQRLGLLPPSTTIYTDDTPTVSPIEGSLSSSDDEAQEACEVDDASIPSSRSRSSVNTPTPVPPVATAVPKPVSTTQRVTKQTTFTGTPSQATKKGSSTPHTLQKGGHQQPPPAPPKTTVKSSAERSSSLTSSGPIRKGSGGTMTGYQGTAGRSSVFKHSTTTKVPTQSASVAANKPSATTKWPSAPSSAQTNTLAPKRLTATRTRKLPALSATNVFAGGKQRKKRANLADVMADPSKTPKAFSKMRLVNLAKKRGIEKGDAVGALSSIPSKLIIGNESENHRSRRHSLISPTAAESPQSNEAFNSSSEPSGTVSKPQVSSGSAQQGGTEEVPKMKRKKSVRFTGEDDEGFASMTDGLFVDTSEKNTSIIAPDAEHRVPMSPKKFSLATYQERGQTQTIEKLVKFGHAEGIMAGFSGVPRHPAAWLSAFKSEEILHLASTCTSYHFSSQREHLIERRLSAGTVAPALPYHTTAVRNVAQSLQQNSTGLHLVALEYSILVYPADCEDWGWLDNEDNKPSPDGFLRYLIYHSNIPFKAYPSTFNEEPKAFNQLIYPNRPNDTEAISLLTGLDFNKMLPQDDKLKEKQVYMLLIPLKARQLLGVFMAWLRYHKPGRPIFTVEQQNSWRLFHEAIQASGAGGTIISHADFTLWKLEKIPNLWRLLEDQKYTFWNLDTGENKRPQYPSDLDAISVPGTLRLTRLFPYGRAFLITPSFAISEPAKLCKLLKWFTVYAANPGHIIVTCHNFPQFLRNITEEKQKEHNTLKWLNPNNNDVYTSFQRTGRSEQDINDHFKAWQLFQEIIERYGDGEETEDIRKIYELSEFIDPSDEQSLVNAFCWWSQLKCDRFRRFYVLGSDPTNFQRAYRYIEVPRYFDTEGSDPDIAGILTQRAAKQDTEANIAWGRDVGAHRGSGVTSEWINSICKTPFSFPSRLFRTGNAYELQRWVDDHRRRTGSNWAKLHQKPVSWRDWNMAVQFGDGDEYKSHFDTFSGWFKAAPKFTAKVNTWYGLFYTVTDTWDEYMPKREYERHPWIAIYRPQNPHLMAFTGKFSSIELFIWDIAAGDRERFGHGLLDMQCQLIDFVYESVAEHYQGCSLSQVWYSSSTKLQIGPDENPLDITCRRIEEMFNNSREELPPKENWIRDRWTLIDPRLWSAGMSSMTLRTKPIGKPSELTLDRIPQTEEDKLKPERSIWHPVHGETRGRGTKCLNDLHETCLQARRRDPQCEFIKYQYRPTQDWWADQESEGRGYGYIRVRPGARIIDKIC